MLRPWLASTDDVSRKNKAFAGIAPKIDFKVSHKRVGAETRCKLSGNSGTRA